jgi:outer membrane murein-binding lipoprotein Lpp
MTRVAKWITLVLTALCLRAMGQDVLVFNDGSTGNGLACLQAAPALALPPAVPAILACPVPGYHFLVQGKRTELQVFNRKFLTDYSISIDAVTQIQTGPNIRNLNEAENLTLGAVTLASIPPSKGGAEGLTARTATQILLELVDETTSTKPRTDLLSDLDIVERERARLAAQIDDFTQHYQLLVGGLAVPPAQQDCQAVIGSPSILPLWECLDDELFREGESPWLGRYPYTDEPEFRHVTTRVHDLVQSVMKLGDQLEGTDLPGKLRSIETAVAQFDNDVRTLTGNLEAAADAANLASGMNDSFRSKLRREETRVLLLDKLKGSDGKPTLDEPQMNALLDLFDRSYAVRKGVANSNVGTLLQDLPGFGNRATAFEGSAGAFIASLENFRFEMNQLPDAISDLNASQAKLLNRVNEIYDHSEVPAPLPKQINLSGHSGNLVVYYTIRRIETFQRYTVAQIREPGSPQANAVGTPLPPAQASGPSPNPANGNPPATNNGSAPATNANPGIVVAQGSFEVHDVFHANVVAAFAFSTLKDQSISKVAQPLSCSGTATTPDTSCFAPYLNGYNRNWGPIIGLDYYLHPRDTFPRTPDSCWLCHQDWRQCVGVMGAASVTAANSYFLGGFFEPTLGVQFGAGANFGNKTTLNNGYTFGTPVDVTGDFPTHEERATGVFISAGLDLGIFRKIFGKVTGIGTAASGTSGK